jgi:hypothetical protein
MTTMDTATRPELKGQAGKLLGNIAGYVEHHTVEIWLRMGLIAELADKRAVPYHQQVSSSRQPGLPPLPPARPRPS